MKLRINTKLRAALIAAITAVGFTLTQAQAEWEGGANEGSEYYTNTGRTNLHLTNTSDALITFTAEQNHVTAGIAEVVTKDLATVRVRGGNHWGSDRAFDMLTIDSIKAGDGSGTVFVNAEKYNDSQAASNSTATVLGINGTLGGVQNYGVLTLGADGGTINASGTIMNNSGATLTLNGTYTFDTTDASNYVTRTEGDVVWSDVANQQGFKKSTGSTFYVIKGATEGTGFSATGVEKESNGNYYFTAGEVTDHSKFYVNAATATLGEDFSGQLVVNKADATVTLDNAAFSGTITGAKANLIVQNGGTLVLTGQTAFGSTDNTFTICEGSTVDLNGKADGNYSYTLAGGTITNSGGNIGEGSSQTVALKLTADSTVNAGSGHDFRLLARGYNPTTLDLGGKTLVKTGTGLFGLFNTTVTAGTIEVREGTFEFNTAHGTASSAANITFNGGNATGAMKLTGDIKLTAQQTVSSGVGINAQNHGLTLDGAGDLTLTGTITNVTGITKTGAGTATITASGSLNKAIAVQEGSLVLGGTYAIDDVALDPDSTIIFYDNTGAEGTSGFRNVAGAKSAYTVAQDASITATGATFTVGGQAVQLNAQGKYLIAGSTDYTTVWANKDDTVDYAAYQTAAQQHESTLTTAMVADGGTVDLGSGATVGTLRFAEAGATAGLEGTGSISSISGAGILNLHDGAQVTVASTTVGAGSTFATTGAGTLSIETLKVDGGTVNIASNLTVTGGGNGKGSTNNNKGLYLTGSGSTVNINGGTTTVTGAVYTNGSGVAINVGTGDAEATLVAGRIELGDNGGGTGSFTIGQKGKVVVTGNEDYRNDTANPQKNTSLQMAEWGQQMTDTIQGKLYAQGATAFMSNDADSTINIDGGTMAVKGIVCSNVSANRAHNISLGNNGKLVLGERGIADETGSWNINLANGEIGMTADTTLGRDMTVTGAVTFNTAKYTWEGSGADLELKQGSEGGTMTVTGTISGSGNITKKGAGTLLVDTLDVTGGSFGLTEGDATIGYVSKTGEGAYTMSSTGTTSLVYGIDLQGGTLTMSGNYDISDIYVESGDPTYEGGEHDGNGFAVVEGTASVVSVEEGAKLDTDGATFTWNDKVVTVESDGTAAVEGTNYGTFYVNTASETVTKAKSMEGSHGALSAIYVADEGTLTVDQDIDASLLHEYSAGIVSINEGKTVTAATGDRYFTLAGSGTYGLGSGVSSLGGVALGDDWTGTVRIGGFGFSNTDLAPYVNSAKTSWVEMNGITGGYIKEWNGGTQAANIKLTDTSDGGAAWTWSDGTSGTSEPTITFSGKWAGDGTFKLSNLRQNITFSGDVEDWDGTFDYSGKNGTTLTFKGDATVINAAIRNNGVNDASNTQKQFHLVVENEASFNNEVSAYTLAVAEGASASFEDSLTANSITVKANASATFNELNITSAIQNSGTVTLNCDMEVTGFEETAGEGGFFDLNGAFSTTGNGYSGTSDSYLTIVDGGTVVADHITVTQGDDTYKMNNSGLALKGDHTVQYGTFYVNTDTVNISAIKTDGHASKVEVVNGTLNVDQAGTGLDITVTNEGTLTGEKLDVTQVGITQYATALFEQGIQDGHVKISSDGEAVEVLNWEEATTKYSLSNSAMVVTAGSIEKISAGDDVTVSNYLNVDDIVNIQGGALTLNGQEDAMTVQNITIGQDSTVKVTDQSGTELTITVEETLAAAGNATLLANLEMADGSALLLDGVQKGVSIGSTLTMNTGIMLDEATLSALDDMAIGDTFWLVGAVVGKPMEYTGESGENAWYDAVFSRTAYDSNYELAGDFNIAFSETDGFGLKKFSNTPEPTTGTLSLLALAALAARRRRH